MNPEITSDIPVNTLDLHVPEIEKVLTLYDRMEVHRSVDNITYEEVTASTDTYATVDGTIAGTWNLNGTLLSISKNSAAPVTINFVGTDPFDLLSIINQINLAFFTPPRKIATQVPSNTNKLRIQSDINGLESNLTISGTAAAILGLSTTKTYGKIHRIVLTNPTVRYQFFDTSAEGLTYYYKTRFSHSSTGRLSGFTNPILCPAIPIVPDLNLVTCSCTLADMQGYPIKNRRIILVIQQPTRVNTITDPFLGVLEQRYEMLTDQYGVASTKVPKNTRVKVYIEDSYLNRIIDTGTVDFNLLDKLSTSYDPYNLLATENLAPVIATLP